MRADDGVVPKIDDGEFRFFQVDEKYEIGCQCEKFEEEAAQKIIDFFQDKMLDAIERDSQVGQDDEIEFAAGDPAAKIEEKLPGELTFRVGRGIRQAALVGPNPRHLPGKDAVKIIAVADFEYPQILDRFLRIRGGFRWGHRLSIHSVISIYNHGNWSRSRFKLE